MRKAILGVLGAVAVFFVVFFYTATHPRTASPSKEPLPKALEPTKDLTGHTLQPSSRNTEQRPIDQAHRVQATSNHNQSFGEAGAMGNKVEKDTRPQAQPAAGVIATKPLEDFTSKAHAIRRIAEKFRPFFEKNGITGATRDQVVELLYQKYRLGIENLMASATVPTTEREAMESALVTAYRKIDEELGKVLSPEQAEALRVDRIASPYRPFVEDTAKIAAEAGYPLTPADSEKVAYLLGEYASPVPRTGQVSERQYKAIRNRDALALQHASTVLSEEQIRIFDQALARRVAVKKN
jgi:hypothetical protein